MADLRTESLNTLSTKLSEELAQAQARVAADVNMRVEAMKQPITTIGTEETVARAAATNDWETFVFNERETSPIPDDQLKSLYFDVQQSKRDAAKAEKDSTLFSHTDLQNSTLATIANNTMGALGRAGDIAGNVLNTGLGIGEAARRATVNDEQWSAYESYAKKYDAFQKYTDDLRHEQDPAKKEILRRLIKENDTSNYTEAEKALLVPEDPNSTSFLNIAPIKRISGIKRVDEMQDVVSKYAGALTAKVNTTDTQAFLTDASKAWDDNEGFIDVMAAAGEAITDNPAGLVQLITKTLPDIASAGLAFAPTLLANMTEKQKEAENLYRATYGKDPIGDDYDRLVLTSMGAGAADTIGDKLVSLGGFNAVGALSKVGLTSGSQLIDTAVGAVAKVTQKGAAGAIGEFVAEGSGDYLTQLAGTQDVDKIKGGQVFAGALGGFAAGGAISTVIGALDDSKNAVAPIAQRMVERVEAKENNDITALVSNPNSMDIVGATKILEQIASSDTATPEQKAKAFMQIDAAYDHNASIKMAIVALNTLKEETGSLTPGQTKQLESLTKTSNEMDAAQEHIKVLADKHADASVEEAYKILTAQTEVAEDGTVTPTPPIEISRQALGTFIKGMESPLNSVSADMAQEILDSKADILTEDQTASLRSFVATRTAMDDLEAKLDTARVNKDIIYGSKTKVGARDYVNAIISDLKRGNTDSATRVAKDLETFAVRHAAKAAAYAKIIEHSKQTGKIPSAEFQRKALETVVITPSDKDIFKNRIPAFVYMMQEEAAMLSTVSQEMNARIELNTASVPVSTVAEAPAEATVDTQPQAVTEPTVVEGETNRASLPRGETVPVSEAGTTQPNVESAIPEANLPSGGTDAVVSGTDTDAEVSTGGEIVEQSADGKQDLESLLDLGVEGAVAKLNTKPTIVENSDDATLAEPGSIDLPEQSNLVKRIQLKDGSAVELVEDTDGSMYAIRNGDVAGIIAPVGTDETSLQLIAGNEGLGIGTELTKEFIRKNPNQGAGSFTAGGKATYTKAIQQLIDETTTADFIADLTTGIGEYVQINENKKQGNPILSDRNFMSSVRAGKFTGLFDEYVADQFKGSVPASVKVLMENFAEFNTQFTDSIKSVFQVADKGFTYKDAISYFVDADGNLKDAVVDAMSVSAFNWLITKSNDSLYKNDSQLNTMFGISDKNKTWSNHTHTTSGQAGLPLEEEAQTVGNEIVNTLALKVDENAPYFLLDAIAASAGLRMFDAMAAMKDSKGDPLIKFIRLSGKDRSISQLHDIDNVEFNEAVEMVNDMKSLPLNDLNTVQVNFSVNEKGYRVPSEAIQGKILAPAKSGGAFFNSLFGTLDKVAAPTFEPVSVNDQKQVMKRTDRKLSQFAKDVNQKFNNVKTYLKGDSVAVLKLFDRMELAELFGYNSDIELTTHVDRLESERSKANGILRSIEGIYDFIEMVEAEADVRNVVDAYSVPFYLSHETTKTNRNQLEQKLMNMQSDKLARHIGYREGWESTIEFSNQKHVQALLLAVGQAIGGDVDKESNTVAIEKAIQKLESPYIAAGVQELIKLLNGKDANVDTIKSAISEAGSNTAAIDGLVTYARFLDAKNTGKESVTVNIGIERDGRTNGPMISLMQFADVNEDWASDLSAGGIYFNSSLENIADAKAAGIKDIYQKVAKRFIEALRTSDSVAVGKNSNLVISDSYKQALETLFDNLGKSDEAGNIVEVYKAGREIGKEGVTPATYQASMKSVQEKLGNKVIDIIIAQLEEMHLAANDAGISAERKLAITTRSVAVANALKVLAPGFIYKPEGTNNSELLKRKLKTKQIYAYPAVNNDGQVYKMNLTFPDFVAKTLGKFLASSIELQNVNSQKMRDDTVRIGNYAVLIYEHARNTLIAEAMEAKGRDAKGLDRYLTKGEMDAINKKLLSIYPEVASATSNKLGEGISLLQFKSGGTNSAGLKVEAKINPKAAAPIYHLDGTSIASQPKSRSVNVGERAIESPGVTPVVNNVLGADGSGLLKTMAKHPEMLGIFDAEMTGLNLDIKTAKQLNRDMYDVAFNHSIPVNVAAMAERVAAGFTTLIKSDVVFKDIAKYKLKDAYGQPLESISLASIQAELSAYKAEAELQQKTKREALTNNQVTFNHYYAEGAAVTFVNGKEVAEPTTKEELDNAYINAVHETAKAVIKANGDLDKADATTLKVSPKPTVLPTATTDNSLEYSPELADILSNGPVLLTEMLKQMPSLETDANAIKGVNAMVTALAPQIGANAYVTSYKPGMQFTGELSWLNAENIDSYFADNRGVLATKAGKTAIILMDKADTSKSGINKETLFHEVIHHLFDSKVFANANSAVGKELNTLMQITKANLLNVTSANPEMQAFVNQFGGENNLPMFTSAKEFLAWGLSSNQFQQILAAVSIPKKSKLVSALSEFKSIVLTAIFGRDVSNETINNALVGLINVAAKLQDTTGTGTTGISRQQGPMAQLYNVTKLTSTELFETLADVGHVIASDSHKEFLGNMLDTVVNAVLKPLKVNVTSTQVDETLGELTANDKFELYTASNTGLQLANLPAQYGFNKSAQESYVYGLYQAILEEGLQVGSPHLNAANTIFNQAKDRMTYRDFMDNPVSQDPVAIAQAQDRFNSVFNVQVIRSRSVTDMSSGMTHTKLQSDYLRNFLALAATNERFRTALDNMSSLVITEPGTLFGKAIRLIGSIIDWLFNRVTGVKPADTTTVNLDRLTKRLVGAELQTQSKVETFLSTSLGYTSQALGGAISMFRKGILKIGEMPVLRDSRFAVVRTVSDLASIVGNNQTEYFYDALGNLLNRFESGKQGFKGELINEIKGTTKDNAKVHSLIRVANFVLDRGRKDVITAMSKALVNQFQGQLTKMEKTAVTKFLLRTDMESLLSRGYDLNQLTDLIDNSAYLQQEITAVEDSIRAAVPTNLAMYYLNQAENLGFTMANGYSPNAHAIPNAYGIARLWGVKTVDAPDVSVIATVEPLIDALASLRAIERTKANQGNTNVIVALMRREAARTDAGNGVNNNGITFTLIHHQQLKAKALKDNFAGDPALMRKGYMPDINNPYIDVQVAPENEVQEMQARGYKLQYVLEKDATDPNPVKMAMYISNGAGLATYMRGALSNTNNKTKGKTVGNFDDVAVMEAIRSAAEPALFTKRTSPINGRNPAYMQAVFNPDGQVSEYRYIMAESTKDTLLERNDDFSEVLGKLAGNIYDKTVTKPHNRMVIDALKTQYDTDKESGRTGNYIRVEPGSADPELREMWAMLPYESRQYAKRVFGTDSVPIRAEFLRVIFGHRNITVASLWEEGGVNNNFFQQTVKNMFDVFSGGNGLYAASRSERIWQEVVRTAKQNVVIRMGTVTMMNLLSNTYQLVINGVGFREALTDQYTGYKKAVEYVQHGSRISELNLMLQANHNPQDTLKMRSELNQLKHLQSINPVGELIEAGLLQTIVMDVNQDTDPFSYGSKLGAKFDAQLEKLPGGAKDAAKFLLMTRDSESYEFMNRLVQFSDFSARYALFKNLTTRKENPMNKTDAINAVITEFINYDLPTHRALQYGNDMGVIWFSRYWLRIQKVIMKNFAENPGRVLTGLALQGMLGADIPNSGDSTVLSTGVFHPIGGVDRVVSGLFANPIIPEL